MINYHNLLAYANFVKTLAKGINPSLRSKIVAINVHDLVETNACDSGQDVCMVGECEYCLTSNLSLSDFDGEKKTISFLSRQGVDKNNAKSTNVFLLIMLLRNGILL